MELNIGDKVQIKSTSDRPYFYLRELEQKDGYLVVADFYKPCLHSDRCPRTDCNSRRSYSFRCMNTTFYCHIEANVKKIGLNISKPKIFQNYRTSETACKNFVW